MIVQRKSTFSKINRKYSRVIKCECFELSVPLSVIPSRVMNIFSSIQKCNEIHKKNKRLIDRDQLWTLYNCEFAITWH